MQKDILQGPQCSLSQFVASVKTKSSISSQITSKGIDKFLKVVDSYHKILTLPKLYDPDNISASEEFIIGICEKISKEMRILILFKILNKSEHIIIFNILLKTLFTKENLNNLTNIIPSNLSIIQPNIYMLYYSISPSTGPQMLDFFIERSLFKMLIKFLDPLSHQDLENFVNFVSIDNLQEENFSCRIHNFFVYTEQYASKFSDKEKPVLIQKILAKKTFESNDFGFHRIFCGATLYLHITIVYTNYLFYVDVLNEKQRNKNANFINLMLDLYKNFFVPAKINFRNLEDWANHLSSGLSYALKFNLIFNKRDALYHSYKNINNKIISFIFEQSDKISEKLGCSKKDFFECSMKAMKMVTKKSLPSKDLLSLEEYLLSSEENLLFSEEYLLALEEYLLSSEEKSVGNTQTINICRLIIARIFSSSEEISFTQETFDFLKQLGCLNKEEQKFGITLYSTKIDNEQQDNFIRAYFHRSEDEQKILDIKYGFESLIACFLAGKDFLRRGFILNEERSMNNLPKDLREKILSYLLPDDVRPEFVPIILENYSVTDVNEHLFNFNPDITRQKTGRLTAQFRH